MQRYPIEHSISLDSSGCEGRKAHQTHNSCVVRGFGTAAKTGSRNRRLIMCAPLPLYQSQIEQIGCRIKFIEGDGNCLFRSLADQLEGRPQDHSSVRTQVRERILYCCVLYVAHGCNAKQMPRKPFA